MHRLPNELLWSPHYSSGFAMRGGGDEERQNFK